MGNENWKGPDVPLLSRVTLRLPDFVERAGKMATTIMVRAGVREDSKWVAFVRGCSEDLGRRLWYLAVDPSNLPIVCPGCYAVGPERCAEWCPDRPSEDEDDDGDGPASTDTEEDDDAF
jgi:hypothetical protein